MKTEQPYSASTFGEWWETLLRFLPFAGPNCRIDRGDYGTLLSSDESLFWKHPWTMTPRLHDGGDSGQPIWVTTVEPGFVNGQDVLIHDVIDQKYKPLTAESAPVMQLGWRDALRAGAGVDSTGENFSTGDEIVAGPGRGYPLAFKNFGIKPIAARGGPDPELNADALATRELRACDIALIVPRIGTIQNISFGDIIGDGQIVQISTSLNTSAVEMYKETPYRLGAFSNWTGPAEPTYLDRLTGAAVEPTTDEIKIGTIWAISPPDADKEDEPGLGWTLYPQYECFFNLMHVTQQRLPVVPPRPITFITPLAAGFGNVLIASFLDPINDAFNGISEMFANATFKGTFYSV